MISDSLRKIERELDALADNAPIDAHAVRVIARKIACQSEMLEQGLSE